MSSSQKKPEVKRGRGCPTKLNAELQKQIAKYASFGVPREVAAQMEGVDDRTIRKWMKWGKEGKKPYDAFRTTVLAAEATATGRASMRVYAAGKSPEHWRALAWWLRTRRPDLFGDTIQLKIEDGLRRFIETAESVLEPAQLSRLLEALTRQVGEEEAPPVGDGEPDP